MLHFTVLFLYIFNLYENYYTCISLLTISVDMDEIKRLGKRFRKLDLDNSGALSIDEFMSLPELHQNPLVQRVIDIFDTDGNGEVDFKGEINNYVKAFHLFTCKISIIVKLMHLSNLRTSKKMPPLKNLETI